MLTGSIAQQLLGKTARSTHASVVAQSDQRVHEPSNVWLPVAGRRRSRVTTASSRAAPRADRLRRPARRAVAEAPRDARPDARARRVDAGVHDLRQALQFSAATTASLPALRRLRLRRLLESSAAPAVLPGPRRPRFSTARGRIARPRGRGGLRARVLALRGRRGCAHTRSRRAADERTAAGDDKRGRGRRVA